MGALPLLLAAVAGSLPAQAPAAAPAGGGEQVTLPVVIHDKHGKALRAMAKEDLTLQVDGHPQTPSMFTVDIGLPLELAMVVDTSMGEGGVLETVRNTSKTFLGRILSGEKDQACLLHYDRQVELLEDLTPSKDKLNHALDLLQTPQLKQADDTRDDSSDESRDAKRGGKQLYDAIFLAADDVLKKPQGRKVMIVLSDGVDRGSKETLNSALEAAQRANITIYAVYLKTEGEPHQNGQQPGRSRVGIPGGGGGGGWPGSGGGGGRRGGQRTPEEAHADGRKILTRISQETGGNILELTKKETLDDIYLAITDDLHAQYSLVFTPTADARGDGYHHIALSTTKKDVFLQVRGGYYSDR